MNSIFIALGLSSLILGGAFLFGVIFSPRIETVVESSRQFSHYEDKSRYYDTVIFTEEDSILSIY